MLPVKGESAFLVLKKRRILARLSGRRRSVAVEMRSGVCGPIKRCVKEGKKNN